MLIEIGYLGRDVVIRHTAAGDPVATLAFAYNYGPKGPDGKRASQWIDCSWWGPQPGKLQEYLTKGTAVEMVLDELHEETFTRRDNTQGHKLVARVVQLKFLSGQRRDAAAAPSSAPATAPATASADPYGPKAPPPRPSVPTGAQAGDAPQAPPEEFPFDDRIPF